MNMVNERLNRQKEENISKRSTVKENFNDTNYSKYVKSLDQHIYK